MRAALKKTLEKDMTLMRDVYAGTLIDLAKSDERIVVLDADLMSSMGMKPFLSAYPGRTFNCGIQEANMIGVASGLSATGMIPFAHTFGCFASRGHATGLSVGGLRRPECTYCRQRSGHYGRI